MLEPNPDIGFTGYHDGKSNNSISATAAENIMAYETNLCLGYTVMEAEAHTLNLSKSVTIENYRNGVFEDSSLITCIRDAAPRVAAQLKAKFGPRCMLGMSSNKDMLMNDTWLESAQAAKSNGLRKTMHKGNPVSDIYILDHDRDCIDTISMKISNSQLCSTSYTDILTLLKTVSYEIPGSYQYLEPIMEPSAHFYKKFPQTMTDLSKYKPGSDEWNTWHYYKNKMALLDNDFKIAESKFPEMKQLIVRHLVSGDFKFREDSLSIAGNVIHLFPSCPSKSYFKTVDEVVDEMCKVCTFETSFKTNTYTMDSWRAQLTYTKADLAELAG